MEKRLTLTEIQRLTNLMSVWDYLYKKRQYKLCDVISTEVGILKGTITEEEVTEKSSKVYYEV